MEDKIRQIIKGVLELEDEIINSVAMDTNLAEIGLDSLKAIEVIVNLEEEFNIEVLEEDLLIDNIDNIFKIVNLVNTYIS